MTAPVITSVTTSVTTAVPPAPPHRQRRARPTCPPRPPHPRPTAVSSVTEWLAAWELGLARHEFDIAVRLGHIDTVPGELPWQRWVSRGEIERLRAAPDFPTRLRAGVRLVSAAGGARLLGISPTRFSRLARGGCLAPLSCQPHRGAPRWRYAAFELRLLAAHRPELLGGLSPPGLGVLLRQGVDWRPRRWRGRHLSLRAGQARDSWELAAVAAVALSPASLAAAVPDPGERALLRRLRPPLPGARPAAHHPPLVADEPDEARWYRLMLCRALAQARRVGPPAVVTGGRRP